jgi:hypothetical protein
MFPCASRSLLLRLWQPLPSYQPSRRPRRTLTHIGGVQTTGLAEGQTAISVPWRNARRRLVGSEDSAASTVSMMDDPCARLTATPTMLHGGSIGIHVVEERQKARRSHAELL